MKVPAFAAISIFCEDVRDEVNDQKTLIGLLPDNLAVPTIPGLLPKLGLFTRMMLPVDAPSDGGLSVFLKSPSGKLVVEATVDVEQIMKAQTDSKEQGAEVAIIITHLLASPFPITEAGRFVAAVRYMEDEYYSGSLNVVVGDSPEESPPA